MNIIENKEAEILDSKHETYDISICVITYNKEKYIRDTIESILMQRTSCKYEIVVGDNLSTDGTRAILKEYWKLYPDKFCLVLNNENLGLTRNIYNTMRKAKGKYIIILYGDDYWISDEKLQSHYDFLENNQEYIGVSSVVESRYSGEEKGFRTFPCKKIRGNKCTLSDYLKGYDFPMVGVMFRNDLFTKQEEHFKKMLDSSLYIDDLSFCILLLMQGDVYVLPKLDGVYRCFRDDEKAGNFNSVNSKKKRSILTIDLLNRLDDLTDGKLDLGVRYGYVLTTMAFAFTKKEVGKKDYVEVVNCIKDKYKKHSKLLLTKGIMKKLMLVTIQK